MDSSFNSPSSRRRTIDFPKSTPETGLAEWTSKIKAIQQEVDRDEEAEQRRLQAEIESSRMERAKRRSAFTGYGIDPNRVNLPVEEMSKLANEQGDSRSEALSKLTGPGPSFTPSRAGLPQEGVSLAAFIGGRATGPRLNKPAPQPDSYDSTTYDQTKREGPHPIFGQPSALRRTQSNTILTQHSLSPVSTPSNAQQHATTNRAPSPTLVEAPKSPVQPPPKPPLSKKPSGDYVSFNKPPKAAEKPMQPKPSPPIPTKPSPLIPTKPSPPIPVKPSLSPSEPLRKVTMESGSSAPIVTPPKPVSLAEMIGGRASGPKLNKPVAVESSDPLDQPAQAHLLPGMDSATRASSSVTMTTPKPVVQRSITIDSPSSKPSSSPPPLRPSSTPTVIVPSLARPIQPKAAAPPSAIAVASPKLSPAFLRATPSTQELHPSLTRLQARGLVEQRVKAASQLFTDNGTTSDTKDHASGSSPQGTGKRPTVLDRWQPASSISSSSSSPSPSPGSSTSKQNLYRQLPGMTPNSSLGRPSTGQSVQERREAEGKAAAPVRLPGLATSMSVPPTVRKEPEAVSASDPTHRQSSSPVVSKPHSMTTAPLSHPTRDRARRPRKGPSTTSTAQPATVQTSATNVQISEALPVNKAESEEPATDTKIMPREADLVDNESQSSSIQKFQALKKELVYPVNNLALSAVPSESVDIKPESSSNGGKYPGLGGYKRPSPSNLDISSVASPRPMAPPSPSISPEASPSTPRPRIPSTGGRATVMDVAQALLEHERHIRETSLTPEPETETPPEEEKEEEEELPPPPDVRSIVAGWGRNNIGQQASQERRRSTYESRFSVATLPPLVEVKTPAETPQASLTRGFAQPEQHPPTAQQVHTALKEWSSEPANIIAEEVPAEAEVDSDGDDSPEPESLPKLDAKVPEQASEQAHVPERDGPKPPSIWEPKLVEQVIVQSTERSLVEKEVSEKPSKDEVVYLNFRDGVLPAFNLQAILKETLFVPDSQSQTISVDILVISGYTATAIKEEPNVFYETEVICVIHRSKERVGELVSNRVWIWRGRDAIFGEKEERKAHDLAERYGTAAIHCMHGSEPSQLIHTLGGVLAIRQGLRAHWSSENTAMHRILRVGDSIFVDELDLGIWNLCSAYSYCLCILGSIYVWHGRGSSEDERKVASTYAESLKKDPSGIIELEEGAEDDMFWMILGNDGYANADYWKFKDQLDRVGSRIFSIDSSRRKAPIQILQGPSALELQNDVFVVDCRLEVFVVVAIGARGKRTDIQLGLFLAQNISAAAAHKRPFNPPIHIVILPSKIPLDLRAAIRLCDEKRLNDGTVPDHMNLLQLGDALDHMQRRSWARSQLLDRTFLPLGVEPSMIEL